MAPFPLVHWVTYRPPGILAQVLGMKSPAFELQHFPNTNSPVLRKNFKLESFRVDFIERLAAGSICGSLLLKPALPFEIRIEINDFYF